MLLVMRFARLAAGPLIEVSSPTSPRGGQDDRGGTSGRSGVEIGVAEPGVDSGHLGGDDDDPGRSEGEPDAVFRLASDGW